jgi:hypothetical protein
VGFFGQVDRIAQIVDRDGEAVLSDDDREIYDAWTAYVAEAAPKIAPRVVRVIETFSALPEDE